MLPCVSLVTGRAAPTSHCVTIQKKVEIYLYYGGAWLRGPTVQTKTYIFTYFTNNIWSYLLWSPVIARLATGQVHRAAKAQQHKGLGKRYQRSKFTLIVRFVYPNSEIYIPGIYIAYNQCHFWCLLSALSYPSVQYITSPN